jgi:LPS export ABC transporter permease LptG/LPS export ABC transporter permease LptF
MKILTRYILKEMLAPTLLGFTFYTSIILMRQLFDFAEMIIKRSLPISTVGELLYLSLPHIVVLTVPMSLLFGILIAVGRMSSDSEIIAMRALGISTKTIYLPVFIFSFAVFLLNLYLMNVVLPKGNTRLTALKAELFTSSIEKIIKPRVFYEEYENLMIYVNDVDPRTGVWKGVFVADSRSDEPAEATTPHAVVENGGQDRAATLGVQSGGQRVVIGESGTLSLMPNKQVWMNLRGAETHIWSPRKPDRYDLNRNAVQRILLPDKFSGETTGRFARSFREMNLTELLAQRRLLRQTTDRVSTNAVEVEIHKKFAIPFACIVFGILGLPLGITNRRGGKSSGFSLSIAIIVVYYILSNNGEHAATNGKLSPFLGMWGPNLVLVAIGIWLLLRANRDAGSERSGGGFFSRIASAVLARRSARRMAVSRRDDDEEPSVLNRLDITFPNIVDRYILREFLKVLGLVLVSVIALSLIIDYTGISGDIRENHIAFHTVFAYYRFMLFTILDWTLPISVLVATLVTFGMLSKNNEITAIKSSGVSLYRIALPILAVSVFVSIFAYLNLDFVLPYSNQRVDYLRRKIKGQVTYASSDQQRVWFRGKGRYLINFLSYDRNAKALSQVQIFEFHPSDFRLTRRVYAQRAAWDGSGWVFENGWMRSFPEGGGSTYSPIVTPLRLYYSETPNDFATEVKAPNQMTFAQLRRYIANIRASGYAPEQLSVELYKKTSWPAISIVMALIALPFAFKSGKKGALYGVAIALILGILYWMIFVIFTKFGEVGNLPAILSAWSANILFAIAAMYLFLHVET